MSYLELAKRLAEALTEPTKATAGTGLEEAPIAETRLEPGAVLIESPRFGPVWVVLDARLLDEIRAEEAQQPEPRPVVTTHDIAALSGKSEAAITAALEVFRVFPGARVAQ